MLRKRPRAMATNHHPLTISDPPPKSTRTPTLFTFSPKASPESDSAMSPTSILETKPFSTLTNPFFSRSIGLGIVDALRETPDRKSSNPESRMVLFGSQLKIQIPFSGSLDSSSPQSPIEFGIKNKSSQLALLSPALRSPMGDAPPPFSPGVFTGCLSASEMEMSEDYTCVIAHGPNPRTTHIFDNCIVKENRFLEGVAGDRRQAYLSDGFLAFCHACRKSLGEGKDIFIYRGEKAFCSSECRYQEMLFDEGEEEKSSLDP